MSAAVNEPVDIEANIARALAQGRVALDALHATVIPSAHPSRRTFPEQIARRIDQGTIWTEAFVRDLDTLLDALRRQIDAGTHMGWQADEHHVRGGWETIHHEDGIDVLMAAAGILEALSAEVRRALDDMEAARIAVELAGG